MHAAPRSVMGGTCRLGENTLFGIGASARPGTIIGARVVVGAGSVVVSTIPDGVTVVAIPPVSGQAPDGDFHREWQPSTLFTALGKHGLGSASFGGSMAHRRRPVARALFQDAGLGSSRVRGQPEQRCQHQLRPSLIDGCPAAPGPSPTRTVDDAGPYRPEERYRGQSSGPFWLTLATGVLIGGIGLLYGGLFGHPLATYLPFVAVSIVIWTFIAATLTEASTSS